MALDKWREVCDELDRNDRCYACRKPPSQCDCPPYDNPDFEYKNVSGKILARRKRFSKEDVNVTAHKMSEV